MKHGNRHLRCDKDSVSICSGQETVRVWLNTSHPDLGGKTALEIILQNKAVAVQTILENAFVGVPS
jgi:hypothetical protein